MIATLAAVLEAAGGHRRVALDALGISRHVFFRLLREPWAQGIVACGPLRPAGLCTRRAWQSGSGERKARAAEKRAQSKNTQGA